MKKNHIISIRVLYQNVFFSRPTVRSSSVTFVRPTQPVEIFGNVSTPFGTVAETSPYRKMSVSSLLSVP